MQAIATTMMLLSIIVPSKIWYPPNEPIEVSVNPQTPITLILTNFDGSTIEPKGTADINGETKVDLRQLFPTIATIGTYVLYAVPRGKAISEFIGTPQVVEVLVDKRRDAPATPLVTRIEPLRYAVITTDQGEATIGFYYDVAPHTVENFLSLAGQNFYKGLTFHKILPGYIIQGGDPRGDGSGGPGYQMEAEFSERKLDAGALAMARSTDPYEVNGVKPRPEFANTAGSQFFICLDYAKTQALDTRYTVFAKVVRGMEMVNKLTAVPLGDPKTGKPIQPPVIRKIEIKLVEAGKNPYPKLMNPDMVP